MKKAAAFILAIVAALVLSACGQPTLSAGPDGSTPKVLSNNQPSAEVSDTDQAEDMQIDYVSVNSSNTDASASSAPSKNGGEESAMSISITVGTSVFSAKLYGNDAARALLAQFPLTLDMSELNGNEKYYYLADNLPSESAERPATINAGDIMCWSGNCLVLFYKTFSNSYGGYVRLGYVEDASGLAAALGSGAAQVTFAAGS